MLTTTANIRESCNKPGTRSFLSAARKSSAVMLLAAAAVAAAPVIGFVAAVQAAPPATQSSSPDQNNEPKVLVLPFEPLTADARRDWLGAAMQHTLATELSQGTGMQTVMPPASNGATTQPAETAADVAAALKLGREAGAKLVIVGFYQVMDQDLRISGQILDVASGKAVGMLRSTGTLRDLFAMEDAIAAQARRQLPSAASQPSSAVPRPADSPAAMAAEVYSIEPTGPVTMSPYSEAAQEEQQADAYSQYLNQYQYAPESACDYDNCDYSPYNNYSPYNGSWPWGLYPLWFGNSFYGHYRHFQHSPRFHPGFGGIHLNFGGARGGFGAPGSFGVPVGRGAVHGR